MMKAQLQRRIQRYGWDKAAADYEEAWQRPLEPAQTALISLAALRRGERVVDISCGTGLVTCVAGAVVGPSGGVVGVDLSDRMVTLARERARQHGQDHVRFERMDAEQLRLPAESFDVALNALGLMYVPDPQNALREMTRVVAPGGRVVAAVWGRRSHCGWAEIFPIIDARVQSDVCPLFFALGTADRLAAVFTDAGLEKVISRRIETELLWTTANEACMAAFSGGPVALAYSRFDPHSRREAHAAYLDSIEPWRQAGGGYAVPGEFVIVSGRKPRGREPFDAAGVARASREPDYFPS